MNPLSLLIKRVRDLLADFEPLTVWKSVELPIIPADDQEVFVSVVLTVYGEAINWDNAFDCVRYVHELVEYGYPYVYAEVVPRDMFRSTPVVQIFVETPLKKGDNWITTGEE